MDPKRLLPLLSGASLLFVAGASFAQTLDDADDFGLPQFYGRGKNVSVMERPRPDYEAIGVILGGFTVYPKIEIDGTASNNLLATDSHPKADVGVIASPSVYLQSNWGRHSLSAVASVQDQSWAKNPSQDETAWTLRTDGRIDIHGDSYIGFGASANQSYEDPGSVLTQNTAAKPVRDTTNGVYARALYGGDRLRAALDADFYTYDFYDVPKIGGGAPIDESGRDYDEARVGGRVDYALSPDAAVFTRVIYGHGVYLSGPQSQRRDFTEVRVLGGFNFDITNLIRGEFGLGYIDHNYQVANYRPLNGLAASAKIEYFPTQLLTLTLTGQRLVNDAAFSTASGYFVNNVALQADYELKRNLIISGIGDF